jgi:hypothetical protein
MDTLEGLTKLAQRARQEQTPVFGVADAVGRRIRSRTPRSVTLLPLGLVGALSAVAASVILALAIELWTYMNSPVMVLAAPLPEMRIW